MGNKFQKNLWQEKEILIEKYVNQKKSMNTIANELGCGETVIHKWLHRHNVSIRPRSEAMAGIEKSEEHKIKLSEWAKKRKGILNANWKHGRAKKHYGLRIKNYRKLRRLTFERDSYECQECGSDMNLHCHHIKTVKDFPELVGDLNNLLTLCRTCHRRLHFPIANFANSVKPQHFNRIEGVGNAELNLLDPSGTNDKCVETIHEAVSNN